MKTTYRFMKNNGLFSVNIQRQKTINEPPIKSRFFRSVKIPTITPFSRARVRTHHRSFYLFAVTSVTENIVKHYISAYYASPEHILTNTFYNPPQHHQKHLEKPQFLAYFFSVSKPYILPSVTLVTAKNLHRCWKAHAYARMRDESSSRGTNLTSKLSKTKLEKNILSLFLRFFSDWVYFPPI